MKPYIFVPTPKNVSSSKDLCIGDMSEIFLKIFDNSGFISNIKIYLNKDSVDNFLFEYNLSLYSDSSADSIDIKRNFYTFKNPEKKVRIKAEVYDAYGNTGVGSTHYKSIDSSKWLLINEYINDTLLDWILIVMGRHQIRVIAYDKSNNSDTAISDTFNIFKPADTIKPTVKVISPTKDSAWPCGSIINITWYATDNEGIKIIV